jgi:DNA-binding protein HU-beta
LANRNDLKKTLKVKLDNKGLKLNKDEISLIVESYEDVVIELLLRDEKVALQGYGNYEVRERAARKGRNPQTGGEIEIPASKSPAFKPAKAFKNQF